MGEPVPGPGEALEAAVDNSGSTRHLADVGLVLPPLFSLVGCPDWCEWSLHYPDHDHVSDGLAELVLWDTPVGFPCVLEVRHAAAPPAPRD